MKKTKLIVFACIMGFFFNSGCNRILDQKPISTVDPNAFWKASSDASSWIAGIYHSLQTTLSTGFYNWGEVRSDNSRVGGTGNAQITMVGNTLSANDRTINDITDWSNLYTTISLCNYGIKNLKEMAELNIEGQAAMFNDYLGQCYGIRALMYFYALRVWGRVPIQTEPIMTVSQPIALPRSSIQAVRDQIEGDIAASLTTIKSASDLKFYMQKAAVYALQTDVAMWFQDYDAALTASQNCINESKCKLVNNIAEWKDIFVDPLGSSETIFNLFWSFAERGDGAGVCQKVGSSSTSSQYEVTSAVWQALKDRVDPVTGRSSDGRYWALWDTLTYIDLATYDDEKNQPECGKYSPWAGAPGGSFIFGGNHECDVKIPIYRFADVLLLRAEALTHRERYQEALDIVNSIRSRVGYKVEARITDYSGNIMAEVERTVLHERQLELVAEGKRWFDLCRIGKTYDYTNSGYEYLREVMNPVLAARQGAILFKDANMGRILFPINSGAFNANLELVGDQNPPYDE